MNKEFRTNFDYRQYMIQNGTQLLQQQQQQAFNQTIFCQYGDGKAKQPSKYLFQHSQDPTQPYGFEASDLKTNYIQHQSHLLIPTQLNDLKVNNEH